MAIEDAPLPEQMRWAAEVAKVAGQRDQLDPNWWTWAAHVFVRRADEWEAEDRAAAERDAMVDRLCARMGELNGGFYPMATDAWRELARRLIADGWTKDGAK